MDVNDVARTLMDAWEQAEGKPVTLSYVATFADMARAVLRDFPHKVQYGVQVVWIDPVESGAVLPGETYVPRWAEFDDKAQADSFAAFYQRYVDAGPHNGVKVVNRATRWAVEEYGEWEVK